MIVRTFDSDFIQQQAEKLIPELLQDFSAAEWLADNKNIALKQGLDVALFDYESSTECFCHMLFESRGKEALALIKVIFSTIFVDYNMQMIYGLVPISRLATRRFARWLNPVCREILQTPDGLQELFTWDRSTWVF